MTAKKKSTNALAASPQGESARLRIEGRLNELSSSGMLARTEVAFRRAAAELAHGQEARYVQFSKNRREDFLAALGAGLTVAAAARFAGVSTRTVYNHRRDDASFAADWEDAREASLGPIEERLTEIALYGEVNSMATVRAGEVLLRYRSRSHTIQATKPSERPTVNIIWPDDGLTPE